MRSNGRANSPSLRWEMAGSCEGRHFGGKVRTKAMARSTQILSWSSVSIPSGSTLTHPRMTFPVMSIGVAWGSRWFISWSSLGSRTIRAPFHGPTVILPLMKKQIDPNIFFSE